MISNSFVFIFLELVDKDCIYEDLESNDLRTQRFTSISPLLCCMLHKLKKSSHSTIVSYTSYILVHILHYQVAPECLIHLAKDIPELPIEKHLLSWLQNSSPVQIKKVHPSMILLSKLNSVLVSDSQIQMNDIFNGNNIVAFKYSDESVTISHSLSPYEIACFCRMTIFYLTQFTKRNVLTKTQMNNYKFLLTSLLHLAKDDPENSILVEECTRFIFTHPIVLHYFEPFHQKTKDITKSMITSMIVDICNVVISMCKRSSARVMFSHFKNKLLTQLHKMIDKNQRSDKVNDVETITSLVELLQLTSQDIVNLLKKLVKLENAIFITKDERNLSVYGHMIPKLLEITCKHEIKSERSAFFELDAEFVKCLCSHLFVLKSKEITDFEKWETTLHSYISQFPFNIAGINMGKLP